MAFTIIMAPLTAPDTPLAGLMAGKIAILLREGLLGAIMGSAVQMPFAALRAAGNLMDTQTGLSMAHMMDPSAGTSQTVLSSFMGMLSMLIFLCMDGHLWILRGLASSFHTLPVAGPWPRLDGIGVWIEMTGTILSTAVQFAAPIVTLLLLTEFSLGIISKILPQLNLLILGQPVRFAMGLASAAAVIGCMEPLTGRIFTDFLGKWAQMILKL
jgi:flagellar biosynthetic protein FliR